MRKLIAGPAILATIAVVSGCAIFQSPEPVSTEMIAARQNVKLYDVIPPNGAPIEQASATACNGTREEATDKLILIASQRGANGIAQLVCTSRGFSFSCFSSATCTGTAINVVAPPPPPPPVLRGTKPKRKRTRQQTP
jgi:hypothetical protein